MNNKNNLDLSKILTDETIEIFEDTVSGPIKTGEGSYQYNIELPPDYTIVDSKPENFTFEEVYKMVQKYWWETEDKKDTAVVYTGIEGKVNYQEQLVKYVGGIFTKEDKDKYRQKLINSGQAIFKL
jgi:hypothetical protein